MLIIGYIWVLLLGGILALILQLRADARGDRMRLPAWNLGWLDAGLYTWLLIILVTAAQTAVSYLLDTLGPAQDNLPAWSLAQGMTFHLTALTLMLILYRMNTLRDKLVLSPHSIRPFPLTTSTLGYFFSGLFLALVAGKAWEIILNTLRELGLTGETPPQELVTVFAEGGVNPINVLLIILAVVVAPITEELLFRAGIYRFLKGRFSPRYALIVSSFFFALMHFNTLSFLPLFLLGMLLCRSYERSGNILVPIGFHALFNANNIGLLVIQGSNGLTEELIPALLLFPIP